jgi:hypothetical protein
MYAKIFSQIFDSSLAEDCVVRHIFMDLLVLADQEGFVDMTYEAIARRTNVPLASIRAAICKLCATDVKSRTKTDDGRRLVPIDESRGWGWQIVNYRQYRDIKTVAEKREYMREYMRKRRERQGAVKPCKDLLNDVTQAEAYTEAEAEAEAEEQPPASSAKPTPPSGSRKRKETTTPEIPSSLNTPAFLESWGRWVKYRTDSRKKMTALTMASQLKKLEAVGPVVSAAMLEQSIEKGWTGIFPVQASVGTDGRRKIEVNDPADRMFNSKE